MHGKAEERRNFVPEPYLTYGIIPIIPFFLFGWLTLNFAARSGSGLELTFSYPCVDLPFSVSHPNTKKKIAHDAPLFMSSMR